MYSYCIWGFYFKFSGERVNAKKKIIEYEEPVSEKTILKIIGMSQSWVSRNRDKEKLPYYKIGKNYEYLISEVLLWRSRRKRN